MIRPTDDDKLVEALIKEAWAVIMKHNPDLEPSMFGAYAKLIAEQNPPKEATIQ